MIPKPYRNKKILELANECPYCCYCGEPNHGQVVACHFNSIRFGAGTGQKSHDIPGFACDYCHSLFDGRIGPNNTKEWRERALYECIYRTFHWLLSEGHLEVR